MKPLVIAAGFVALTGCAQLTQVGESMAQACSTYLTVRAVVELAAWLHPPIGASVTAITTAVDPVCNAVLAGQPAPVGTDAAWVRQKTFALEELERGAR